MTSSHSTANPQHDAFARSGDAGPNPRGVGVGLLDAIGGVGGLGFHVYYGGDGIPAAPHRAICARSGGTRLRPPTQYGVRLRTSNPDYGPTNPDYRPTITDRFPCWYSFISELP